MSAPETHDPLVVNTQDGSCWMRRAVTRDGHGLYALAGTVAGAPDEVLATIPELAADHKLASMAFALPMPVGPAPHEVVDAAEQLDFLHRVTLPDLRGAVEHHQAGKARWRKRAETAEARVTELEAEREALLAERHVTNEALDDAVQELRARQGESPAETVTVRPAGDVTPQVQKLREILAEQRAAVEDPHDSPLHHSYRVPRDLPAPGGAT